MLRSVSKKSASTINDVVYLCLLAVECSMQIIAAIALQYVNIIYSDQSRRLREVYKAHFPFSFYGM
jgi:hypothetical protein